MGRLKRRRFPTVVVSCEHASNAVPARYRNLGLDVEILQAHIAWDIGARQVARSFARVLGCELFEGRWSRLLVDLNRSANHKKVMAESSFGIQVPGNRDLTDEERERRLSKYWHPYRTAVEAAVRDAIARSGTCVHLSVHSFTPAPHGEVRNADVGILYDPTHRLERDLARRWATAITAAGVRVRLNYPYRGTADALTTSLRRSFPASAYAGLELELNQRLFANCAERTHIERMTRESFLAIVRR